MSLPRRARRLAAPIVMTAVAAGCAAPAAPEPIHMNPPPQEVSQPVTAAAPASAPRDYGRGNPPPPELPMPSGKGNVVKQPDGTCLQYAEIAPCPPKAACNPPPPHQVVCPR